MGKKESNEQKTENPADISGFIDDLEKKGVEIAAELKPKLIENLIKINGQKVQVSDIFPGFKKKSKEHELLLSLSSKNLIQPVGCGSWEAKSTTRLTEEGRKLARSHNISVTPLVFVSYAHEDTEWKNLLMRHLGVLSKSAHVESWDDNMIGVGQEFKTEILDALKTADAAVLLISADFFDSQFIHTEEIPHILEGRAKDVFPILIRPCAWKASKWLRKMKVHHAEGNMALSEHANGRNLSEHIPPPVERCLSDFILQVANRMAQVNGNSYDLD